MPNYLAFTNKAFNFRYTLQLIQEIELLINGFKLENYLARSYSKGFKDSQNLAMTRSIKVVNLKVSSFYVTAVALKRGSQSLSTTSARSSQKWVKEESVRTIDFFGFCPQKMELIWYWQRLSRDYICLNMPYYQDYITLAVRQQSIGERPKMHAIKVKTENSHLQVQNIAFFDEKPNKRVFYREQMRYWFEGEDYYAGISQFSAQIEYVLASYYESITTVTLRWSFFLQDKAKTPYFYFRDHFSSELLKLKVTF